MDVRQESLASTFRRMLEGRCGHAPNFRKLTAEGVEGLGLVIGGALELPIVDKNGHSRPPDADLTTPASGAGRVCLPRPLSIGCNGKCV